MTALARRRLAAHALIRQQGYNIGLNYKQKRCSFCENPHILFNSFITPPG